MNSQPPPDDDRQNWPTRWIGLHDDDPPPGWDLTPEERILMVWPLTLQLWAMMGESVEPDFSRDTERLFRRER